MVITILGDNPATINVDDTYTDLGATITAPLADLNLDLKYFLNSLHHSKVPVGARFGSK
jgi:hypothetical protein